MTQQKRSPLKKEALHNSGESLFRRREDLSYDFLSYFFIIVLLWLNFAITWYYLSLNKEPPFWPWFATNVIATIYCLNKARPLLAQIKNSRLGYQGEKYVGQILDNLRDKDFKVFHDVINESGNIDHIVICRKGFFTIETKTYSKYIDKAFQQIRSDGQDLLINGFQNKQILSQAKAEAFWLSGQIKAITGVKEWVTPVIVFPGWFVPEQEKYTKTDTWVINPERFGKLIADLPESYTEAEIHKFTTIVERIIRESARIGTEKRN